MSTYKGEVHIELADNFLQAFPIGAELTLKEFDDYLEQQGLCEPVGDRVTSNPNYAAQALVRNSIRKNINAGAACELRDDAERFQVSVYQHGESYSVMPLSNEVSNQYRLLPERLKKYINNRVAKADYLYENADLLQLSLEQRLHVSHARRDALKSLRRINHELNLLEQSSAEDLAEIENQIALQQTTKIEDQSEDTGGETDVTGKTNTRPSQRRQGNNAH